MSERKNEAIWIDSRRRWQINVQSNGQRRTFTSPTAGKKGKIEAEKKADKWLEEGNVGDHTKCTVLLDKYFAHVEAATSKANWRPIRNHIEGYIRPAIGNKKISRVTENDLQKIIDTAYAKGKSRRMLRNIKSTVVAFIKYCRKERVTDLCPEGLTIPQGAKRSEKTVAGPKDIRTLFAEDQTTWRSVVRPDRYIHAYRFLVLTGLRLGELLGLQWDDIGGNKLVIQRALNDDGEITDGKNDNARRPIKITGLAVKELEQQRALLMQEGILSKYVFPKKDATFTSQDTFRDYWNRYRDFNGIKKVTPYELRHTYVSVNKEMPEGLKKLVIGHSQDMDTEGTYGHRMAGDLERAAEYSDAAFKEILDGTR